MAIDPRHASRRPATEDGSAPDRRLPGSVGQSAQPRAEPLRPLGDEVIEPNRDHVAKLSDLLCFDLYAAARAVTRAYGPHLAVVGLTYPQYLVMVTLWQHAPRTVKELGESLDLDSGTLSPLLKRLEATGLVTRHRRTDDERTVEIAPTPKGQDLMRAAAGVPSAMAAAMGISAQEARQLRALLGKLVVSFGRDQSYARARAATEETRGLSVRSAAS
jgi:MarR family transcriptional regulator, organic hydroperoxide resistance regulator